MAIYPLTSTRRMVTMRPWLRLMLWLFGTVLLLRALRDFWSSVPTSIKWSYGKPGIKRSTWNLPTKLARWSEFAVTLGYAPLAR